MAASPQIVPRELIIRDLDGNTATIALDHDRITLGRSGANELSYPDDIGLSRQHLALVNHEGHWTVEDRAATVNDPPVSACEQTGQSCMHGAPTGAK